MESLKGHFKKNKILKYFFFVWLQLHILCFYIRNAILKIILSFKGKFLTRERPQRTSSQNLRFCPGTPNQFFGTKKIYFKNKLVPGADDPRAKASETPSKQPNQQYFVNFLYFKYGLLKGHFRYRTLRLTLKIDILRSCFIEETVKSNF